jgi:hypothetical protein
MEFSQEVSMSSSDIKVCCGDRGGRLGRLVRLGVACAVAAFLAGCNPSKGHLEQFNGIYQQGQFDRAAEFSQQRMGKPGFPGDNNLLWSMQSGAVERARKNFQQSNTLFDQCEEMIKTFDVQMRQTDIIGTTLVNDNIIPYRGWAYDGIMVNTYKALNFMSMGNNDYARIEFNRAMERQTRAKEKFSQEIQKEKDRVEKANAKKTVDYTKTTGSPEVQNRLTKAYPDLYGFEAYPDYVNPFSTYLAGVYFMATGDAGKARNLLRESAGMLPNNSYVQKDYASADKWLGGQQMPEPRIWVFFENGLGPVKEEFRIDLPLFLVSRKVLYAGIALPKLVKRQGACERLTIQSQGKSYPTEIVGDMDRVVQTEFAKEFPWILTRALIAAGAKAAAQNAIMQNSGNDNLSMSAGRVIAGLAVAAYSAATTAADVRIWSALPKDFQVATIPMPADGQLVIMTPGNRAIPVAIGSCRYAIVYIKIVSPLSDAVIEVIKY